MNRKYKLHENDDCTYLYNVEKKQLYISLSFEDLRHPQFCYDHFVVDIEEYEPDNADDTVQEMIDMLYELYI